jgi:hypothetical protein
MIVREDPLSPGILDMFFLKISDHSSLCKTEVIYLKFRQIYNSITSNDPTWGRQFDSILSVEFGVILLPVLVLSVWCSGTDLYSTDGIFSFYRNKCAIFHYFAFLNRRVSLKVREFTYSKFQRIINSTTHQILSVGGSSIPLSRELKSMLCSWVWDRLIQPELQ